MGEMPRTGQVHGHPGFVRGINNLGVADGAAWLDHRSHTGIGQHLEPVGEGENASEAATEPGARSSSPKCWRV